MARRRAMKVYILTMTFEDTKKCSVFEVFSSRELCEELIQKDHPKAVKLSENQWETQTLYGNRFFYINIEEWDVMNSFEEHNLAEEKAMLSVFPQPKIDECLE